MKKTIQVSVLTSLYNCKQFLAGYFEALSSINGKERIEVLLLHNAPQESELAIVNHYLPSLDFVRHIIIPEREGLYATWNRGIRLSEGEYITVWNVDDIRFPESILHQADALDKNPEAVIAYGDIWVSSQYAVQGSKKTDSPDFNSCTRYRFLQEYHISCFQMWRKAIHQTIGYYDEQLKCIADFDFQIRAAIHFSFIKVPELLGIYLMYQPHQISSNGLQLIEYNVIAIRYVGYKLLNLCLLPQTRRKYQMKKMLFFGEWQIFEEKVPFKWSFLKIIRASFHSLYWFCRQIIKKLLFQIFILKT